MAVALTALFIALGGTSYAMTKLPDNSVGTAQLKNGAVTKPKLNLSGVTAPNSNALGGHPASAYVRSGASGGAWHLVGDAGQPAFQNSWANYGNGFAEAGFYRDPIGFVHLKGIVTGGTSDSTIFTLPAGYRPPQTLAFSVAASSGSPGVEDIDVYSNGNVFAFGSSDPVGLDGITFRVH
jgi:hypothetical protein